MHNINKALQSYSYCVCYCTAASYNIVDLAQLFKRKGYFTRLSRDVLHVCSTQKPGDIFFFAHGSFVSWGFKKGEESEWIDYLKPFESQPLKMPEEDEFYFRQGNETIIETHERLNLDIITLDSNDSQVKLAISYGLAQSVKLQSFEESIQEAIKTNSSLPKEIALRGVISLSRRAIFKRMGEIFISRSSINLDSEYLDIPEFFWRHPNHEPFYHLTKQFLDIPSRVMSLNQKLDVLQELLDILNSQVQHRHSSLLEIIIIVLIAVEIVINLYQFHVW